jgi:hypothetical protein
MIKGNTSKDLLIYNKERIELFKISKIMKLLDEGILESAVNRETFLAALQGWSNYFQRVMYARQAFCFEEPYYSLFLKHLEEEFGHDILLKKEHTTGLVIRDAYIEAAGTWFLNRMLSSTNLEKLLIVNLVLESCGDVFYNKVFPFFKANMKKKGGFFHIHAEADEDHSQLGMNLLKNLNDDVYVHLIDLTKQSWDMIEIILDRIALYLECNQKVG